MFVSLIMYLWYCTIDLHSRNFVATALKSISILLFCFCQYFDSLKRVLYTPKWNGNLLKMDLIAASLYELWAGCQNLNPSLCMLHITQRYMKVKINRWDNFHFLSCHDVLLYDYTIIIVSVSLPFKLSNSLRMVTT